MSDFRILYATPDGGVAVIIPVPDCGLTTEEIAAKDVPTGTPYKIVSAADIPSDRAFRNAWEYSDGVVINMNKAREIHRDHMRAVRAPLLAQLDIDFQRALETGADVSDIVAQKHALRNVTADPAIDAAQTPEELKSVWPSILGEA